jgi:3-(3-hydroxy-phenyl)propionate hydroxylase
MQTDQAAVVIVGYGPVGVTLANMLGQRGISVIVFERETEVYNLPRAAHLSGDIMRIFQSIGLSEEISRYVLPAYKTQFVNGRGHTLTELEVNPKAYSDGYYPSNMFYQPKVEEILRQGVSRFPSVKVNLNYAVESITQNAAGVQVTARQRTNNELTTVQAQYLIGCDGSKSFVRSTLGVKLHDYKFDQPWLVIDTVLNKPELMRPVLQICDPNRPASFIPIAKDRLRWEFALNPGETAEDLLKPEMIKKLISRWHNPDNLTVQRSAVYRFHGLLAQQWRVGRIFLAGDAAHQMPPFLGQGMCSGIRDADNLSWKMAMVLKGQAEDSLLDTYQTEREPHVATIIEGSLKIGKTVQIQNKAQAFLRDVIMKTKRTLSGNKKEHFRPQPPLGAGILQRGKSHDKNSALVGTPLIQPYVTTASGQTLRLDEVLGTGFAVLSWNNDPTIALSPEGRQDLKRLNFRFIKVVPSQEQLAFNELVETVQDTEGHLSRWFSEHGLNTAIVRPDRYLYAVLNITELKPSLEQLCHQVSASKPMVSVTVAAK